MKTSAAYLRGAILVLIAACLWATLGLFYRVLSDQFGLSKGTIVAYRAGIAAVVVVVALAIVRPRLLIVRRRDWLFFVVFGVVGVAAFFWCYVQATTTGPLAIAAVLLYTAPIWIAVWGVLRQGERLSRSKQIALACAFGGCALVANVFDRANLAVNGPALIYGVLSGLSYAAYSLWCAEGVRRGYSAWTILAYALGIGALVLLVVQPPADTLRPFSVPRAWPWLLGVSLGPSLLAQTAFTAGLRTLRTSTASILATIEPVVAALIGWLIIVPPEPLNAVQIAGGVLVMTAVILLIRGGDQPVPRAAEPLPSTTIST